MALRPSTLLQTAQATADELECRPGYLLKRVASAAMVDLSERLVPLDLRQVDVSVLVLVDANDGVIGSHVAQMLDIKGANMVPLLRRLEDADLLRREPIDGKSHALYLTAHGEAVLEKAREVLEEFEDNLMARVPKELRTPFVTALQAIWKGL